MAPRRARIAVSVVFLVCGAAFATWAARVPAAQERLGLTEGELALGLFGLVTGSVLAMLAAGPIITMIGSRRSSIAGAAVLSAGLPAAAAAPDLGLFVAGAPRRRRAPGSSRYARPADLVLPSWRAGTGQ